MDYKVFLKETKNNPEDWDICVAIEYKNHAAMDGIAAKGEMARDKIIGGKQQGQQPSEKRAEVREIISSELLQGNLLEGNAWQQAGVFDLGPGNSPGPFYYFLY